MHENLDDVWLDGDAMDEAAVREKRRSYRLAMVGAIGISYGIDALLLTLFFLAGTVASIVPFSYALAGLAHVVIFGGIQWFRLSERFADNYLTVWQMGYAIAINLLFMGLAPNIRAYFLGLIFVIFGFGALRLSLRAALLMWASSAVAIAVALSHFHVRAASIVNPSDFETLVIWLSFSLTLLRCVYLGYYATSLRIRVLERNQALAERVQVAQQMAFHDELTGAMNRHAILPLINDQIHLRGRHQTESCLAMIDLDHFKEVNDHYGHVVGDQVLRKLVRFIQGSVRAPDKLGRYGGEEFILLMPNTTLENGTELIDRLRREVAERDWSQIAPGLKIHVSAGVADIRNNDSLLELLTRADSALYLAKQSGRNRVVNAEEAMAAGAAAGSSGLSAKPG